MTFPLDKTTEYTACAATAPAMVAIERVIGFSRIALQNNMFIRKEVILTWAYLAQRNKM
jgi:hypothetical protein